MVDVVSNVESNVQIVNSLPAVGAVFGADVGYSKDRSTTGLGILAWDHTKVTFACENAKTCVEDRKRVIAALKARSGNPNLFLSCGIDGPLRSNLKLDTGTCRAAESILMSGKFGRRGKPGATNGGGGPELHQAATELARLIDRECQLLAPSFELNIGVRSFVEAFPNLFLGVLCPDSKYPLRPRQGRNWTCTLYPIVKQTLHAMLKWMLPNRRFEGDFDLTDHEHIAAFVCALTALTAAAGEYAAVGDAAGGYIYLPPVAFWGTVEETGGFWADDEIARIVNSKKILARFPAAVYWKSGRSKLLME